MSSSRLYVGNLSFSTSAPVLGKLFESAGTVFALLITLLRVILILPFFRVTFTNV
jgi:RNA recognition motif-containing protein